LPSDPDASGPEVVYLSVLRWTIPVAGAGPHGTARRGGVASAKCVRESPG